MNQWQRKYAAEHNCIFADFYTPLVDNRGFMKKGFSVDGLHPTAAGYAAIEPVLAAALRAARAD
jgi:lysophospholipase L1-like esterase